MKDFWKRNLNKHTKKNAGILVAVVLVVDGLTHLYWATGSTWPAPNAKTLSLAVLNMNVSFGPQITLPLACILFGGAATVLARVDRLGGFGQRIPGLLLQLGTLAIATGLFLRGVAGIIWITGLGANPSTPFYWLNLFFYTPACLILFALAVAAAYFPFLKRVGI